MAKHAYIDRGDNDHQSFCLYRLEDGYPCGLRLTNSIHNMFKRSTALKVGTTVILRTNRYNYPPDPIKMGDKGVFREKLNFWDKRPYQVRFGKYLLQLGKEDFTLNETRSGLIRWLSAK